MRFISEHESLLLLGALHQYQKRRGLTTERLAVKLGINRRTWSRYWNRVRSGRPVRLEYGLASRAAMLVGAAPPVPVNNLRRISWMQVIGNWQASCRQLHEITPNTEDREALRITLLLDIAAPLLIKCAERNFKPQLYTLIQADDCSVVIRLLAFQAYGDNSFPEIQLRASSAPPVIDVFRRTADGKAFPVAMGPLMAPFLEQLVEALMHKDLEFQASAKLKRARQDQMLAAFETAIQRTFSDE